MSYGTTIFVAITNYSIIVSDPLLQTCGSHTFAFPVSITLPHQPCATATAGATAANKDEQGRGWMRARTNEGKDGQGQGQMRAQGGQNEVSASQCSQRLLGPPRCLQRPAQMPKTRNEH
jgi:hypothetical protein